jgi:hypothetical protein
MSIESYEWFFYGLHRYVISFSIGFPLKRADPKRKVIFKERRHPKTTPTIFYRTGGFKRGKEQ